jgi:hypothetical protein
VTATDRLFSALMRRDLDAEQEMAEGVRSHVASNGLRQVAAQALQSSGDQTVNASTVLPWLFQALGVPPALVGLLVPVRESGSMLPQAFLTPLVLQVHHRRWVFVAGALVQAAAVAVMAATAVLGSGLSAGIVIVGALAVFSLGRSLCSISSKDVQGRTVPKGERGQINGLATTAAGLTAITLGLAIRSLGGADLDPSRLALILALGVVLWVGAAVLYAGVREPDDLTGAEDGDEGARSSLALLREDRTLRGFVTVRSLLLVSALSPPFVVALSLGSGGEGLSGLGAFVIASGVAALLGGPIFGRWADRSSRTVMTVGAAIASAVVLVLVLVVGLLDPTDSPWSDLLFVGSYFVLTLMHTGVRVGRKTYVVDMAEGDLRTTYVAVSNTAMGIVLLVVGGISSALAVLAVEWALVFLAVLGLVGVVTSRRLPEVSHRGAR